MCIPHLVQSILYLMTQLRLKVGRKRQIGIEIVVFINITNSLNAKHFALKAA